MSDHTFLRNNLYQITSNEGELVANLWKTNVYQTSSRWGRVWVWIYSVIDRFTDENLQEKNLQSTLEKVKSIFNKQLAITESDIEKYQTYIINKTLGKAVNEASIHPLRDRITEWNRATQFYFKNGQNNQYLSPLNKTTIETFSALQRIIRFEGQFHVPIPFKMIHKMAKSEPLNSGENISLKRWISNSKSLNVRKVHRFLTSLFKIWELHFEDLDIGLLEENLFKEGLEVFIDEDPAHTRWKNSLQPGDTIICNDKSYLLGKQIGKKNDSNDSIIYFTLPAEPEKLLAIANSEAILRLRLRTANRNQWGLTTSKTDEIDSSGGYSIIERFSEPLENHSWVSKNNTISTVDKNFADPIAKLIKFMIDEDFTSKNFTPHLVMYDKEGTLRSVKTCIWKPFCFKTLEKFIFDFSNGNRYIFRYLMTQSTLTNHKTAYLYRSLIHNIFKNKPIDMAGFKDPKIKKHATQLFETFKKYREQLEIDNNDATKLIYKKYVQSGGASILIIQ